MLCRIAKVVSGACLSVLASTTVASAQTERSVLFDHPVRLDSQGKLLSWIPGQAPYATLISRAWKAFERIPVQANGYRTYFTNPTFYGSTTKEHRQFEGRDWYHNPAGLFTMLTDGALLYRAFSGDEVVIQRVREMLDHQLRFGMTAPTDAWASVPYASSDPGDPVYRGAVSSRFEADGKSHGRGDGVGFLEPDKVGEMGCAFLSFYEATSAAKYRTAALHCADALAKNIRPGDASHSPWAFRVDAKTGRHEDEPYTADVIGPIRLFDELAHSGVHSLRYSKARRMAWHWLMTYPMQNNVWSQYFEDVLKYDDYRENIDQYIPLETARYFMQHPELDPQWKPHAKALIEWVTSHFAIDSTTMGGLHEKGKQWGAEAVSEQINDMDKMSSHTARFASVLALWYEKTGDLSAKERAFRSFNWATYSARESGLTKTSLDEGTGYWFSDGYGDYMRHFQRGIASVPEWAPVNEDHILGSTSVVRFASYSPHLLRYTTFDRSGQEVLHLRRIPKSIRCQGRGMRRVIVSTSKAGYTMAAVPSGGFTVTVHRASGNAIEIRM
ncbi:MAG: hypothetical protein P4L46_01255 [Fimbriimonas sp.]|nr:hypothetical protein [Fimbriimonas sp.]